MQVPQCSHWVRGGIVLLVVLVLVVVLLLVPELGSERISQCLEAYQVPTVSQVAKATKS